MLMGQVRRLSVAGAIAFIATAAAGHVDTEAALTVLPTIERKTIQVTQQGVLLQLMKPGFHPTAQSQLLMLTSQRFDTEFPLPSSVRNFQTLQGPGEAAINFQTDLNLSQAIAFYRQQFSRIGLTERTVNTAITDSTFSLIFDTWPNGKPVVVQGVSMGNSTNISIRLDDV